MVKSKAKGIAIELLCQAYLSSLGYNISVPIGEDCRYDFILDIEGKLLRIQVKSCNEEKNGVSFFTYSITTSGKENVVHTYSKDEIDFFATYYNEQCYLIPVEECQGRKRSLSFTGKKTNATIPLFIDDYRAEKIINDITNGIEYKSKEDEFMVYLYSKDGVLLNSFSSYSEAGRSLGKPPSHISLCARGLRKTAYDYVWTLSLKD